MENEISKIDLSQPIDCPASLVSGFYIDVENLQGAKQESGNAQKIVKSLVVTWPQSAPRISKISLYVRADQVELWGLWAKSEFPDVLVSVKGVQHFSYSQSKNSADIAMALDALSDTLLGRVNFVVLLSDDSDFIALYVKLRDEQEQIGYSDKEVPLEWVLTDREGTRSDTIKDFFPNKYIRVVPFPTGTSGATYNTGENGSGGENLPIQAEGDDFRKMALAIIENIPVGEFKSTDCREVISRCSPDHPLATASDPTYGTDFYKKIFPILESYGVDNPSARPRRYYMTQRAKDSV